jgi:hypothetical protein
MLNNPYLIRGRGNTGILSPDLFARINPPIDRHSLENIRIKDIWANSRLKSFHEVNVAFNGSLSLVMYMRLNEWSVCWDKKALAGTGTGIHFNDFLGTFKKGSQPFRRILSKKYDQIGCKQRIKSFGNFCKIAGTPADLDNDLKGKVLSWWDKNFLPNRYKEFLFKYTSNTLGLNSRVAHYNVNVNAGCTFCSINKMFPAPQESFRHLFMDCITTSMIHNRAGRDFFPELVINSNLQKEKLWFFGIYETDNLTGNLFLQMLVGCIQIFIWECKLKKVLPSWDGVREFLYIKIRGWLQISSTLNDSRVSLNFNVFRSW